MSEGTRNAKRDLWDLTWLLLFCWNPASWSDAEHMDANIAMPQAMMTAQASMGQWATKWKRETCPGWGLVCSSAC